MTGTISGGSLMILGWPSTTLASFLNACMLSRVLALARTCAVNFARAGFNWERIEGSTWSTSRWAYHTSRFVWPANVRIASR